ncbi:MAG TPA: ornithine cyclodeaminase family protein, partial [Anaerolineae bacterium]|nr:ornithine cyclodeaminase family protein [Anaerolineae bacterium]
MSELLILSAENVRTALPMDACIDGMKQAYAALSTGVAELPVRTSVAVPDQEAVALFMPARVGADLAIKVVSVFPRNVGRGEPLIYASVLVLDALSGAPLALLEGGALTAIRTGAGGGASADLLARRSASTVAMIGSGVQARTGLAAICSVRKIDTVRVFSSHLAHAEQFCAEMAGRGPIPLNVKAVADVSAAVRGADIVYSATTAAQPTFDGRDLQAGAHVIGVGSYTPQMQEVDAVTLRRALVVVDSREAVLAEAGDLLVP